MCASYNGFYTQGDQQQRDLHLNLSQLSYIYWILIEG